MNEGKGRQSYTFKYTRNRKFFTKIRPLFERKKKIQKEKEVMSYELLPV